jgi:hypothetical protein
MRYQSTAVNYFTLSTDQGDSFGEFLGSEYCLLGTGGKDTLSDGSPSLPIAMDSGLVLAQFRFAGLVKDARPHAVHDKLPADQGSHDGQLKSAECSLEGYGVEMDSGEVDRYLLSGDAFKTGLHSRVVAVVDLGSRKRCFHFKGLLTRSIPIRVGTKLDVAHDCRPFIFRPRRESFSVHSHFSSSTKI